MANEKDRVEILEIASRIQVPFQDAVEFALAAKRGGYSSPQCLDPTIVGLDSFYCTKRLGKHELSLADVIDIRARMRLMEAVMVHGIMAEVMDRL